MILKGMVTIFVLCQCFTIGADAYELICTLGASMRDETICTSNIHIDNVINVSHFMLAVNSSVNFIFYMMNIEGFKKEFLNVSTNHSLCFNCISHYSFKLYFNIHLIPTHDFSDVHTNRFSMYTATK